MTTRMNSGVQRSASLTTHRWLMIGLQAAAGAILAVLLTQAAILALWPELAAFKPLDSYARSAVFTFVPVMGATAVFYWLVKTQSQPAVKFLWVAFGFLLLSFIPDYLLPIPSRTLAGSTAAAFLHVVAGLVTVPLILAGYTRSVKN